MSLGLPFEIAPAALRVALLLAESVAATAIGLVALALLRRRHAASERALATATFAGLLLLPALALASEGWRAPQPSGVAFEVEAAEPRGSTAAKLGTVLVALWIAGAVVVLARAAAGAARVARIRAAARPLAIGERAAVRANVRARLGRSDLPEILVSERIAVPLAIGIARPAVLLPARQVAGASDVELADVLVHECAHHLGGDLFVAVLEVACRALYWPNPLLHRLARELANAREAACDDVVLAHAPAVRFARTLLACARHAADGARGPGIALVSPAGSLERRVARLLDAERRHAPRAGRGATAAAVALLVATATLAAFARVGAPPRPAASAHPAARPALPESEPTPFVYAFWTVTPIEFTGTFESH